MNSLERAAIRQAAEASYQDAAGEDGQAPGYSRGPSYYGRPMHGEKTFLHRCVQGVVALLVLLAHVFFYLCREGVRLGAHYERRYHVSQVAASAVAKYGVVLRARISAMSDSQAGHAVGALTTWALENVIAGVQDGLGEGMQMVRKQP